MRIGLSGFLVGTGGALFIFGALLGIGPLIAALTRGGLATCLVVVGAAVVALGLHIWSPWKR